MIPIRLTLAGIYSYQSAQTIDFERLTSGKVFGIFGGVGSGKSTILEAISFALYNKTERLNSNRGYNMMNLRSNQLLIDFEFESDSGKRYRFVVQGKRNKRQFDKVNTFKRMGYERKEGQWIPLEAHTAEEIVGLSYENFRRTIIIPQGKFREFLELGPTERRRMLLELFGLHKFDLFEPVSQLFHEGKLKLEHLAGRLSALEEYSTEMLDTLHAQIESSKTQLQGVEEELDRTRMRYLRLQQLQQAHKELEQVQVELGVLKSKEDAMGALKEEMNGKIYCIEHFKTDLTSWEDKRQVSRELEQKLRSASRELKEREALLQQLEEKLATLTPKAEVQAQMARLQKDIELLLQRIQMERQKSEIEVRLEKGMEYIDAHKQKVKEWNDQRQHLQDALAAIQHRLPDPSAINRWRETLVTMEGLREQQAQVEVEIDKLERKHGALYTTFLDQLRVLSIDQLPIEDTPLPDIKASIDELEQELNREEQKLQSALKERELQANLKEQADRLKPGMPCLLCGSKEHPSPLVLEGITDEILAFNERIERLHHRLASLAEARKYILAYAAASREVYDQLNRQRERAQKGVAKLESTRQSLPAHIEGYAHCPSIKAALSAVDSDRKQAQIHLDQLGLIDKELDEARRTLQQYQRRIETLERERQGIVSGLEIVTDQLSAEVLEEFRSMQAVQLKTLSNQLKEEGNMKIQVYEETQSAVRQMQLELEGLRASAAEMKARLHEEEQVMHAAEKRLGKALEASPFADMESVRKLLHSPLDIAKTQTELQAYATRKNHLSQRLEQLQAATQDASLETGDLDALSLRVAGLAQESNALKNSLGSMEQQQKMLVAKLEEKRQFKVQHGQASSRLENLQVLRNLFMRGGFIDFASTVYLQQLCISANKRFHLLTRHQLSLELTADNQFQVRDYLNEGRVRGIKTLSGGQMFQLSLSLALALADSIRQHRGSAQNFFFLDEGFGTLDGNALRLVLDTLKSLRKENRVVGIISHVEALQEEVDVALLVDNDPAEGTRVHMKV